MSRRLVHRVLGTTACTALVLSFLVLRPPSAGADTPVGTVHAFSADVTSPHDLTVGPDGNLWYVGFGGIGRITPAGESTPILHPLIQDPEGIVTGPDGNLWFTNWGSSTIGRITPAGAVTTFGHADIAGPNGITVGPDGALWFVNSLGDGSLGRITTAGVVDIVTVTPDLLSFPVDLTFDSEGNIWTTNIGVDAIVRVTPDGEATRFARHAVDSPDGIVVGPDGNVWFGDEGDAQVGRMEPDGTLTEFDVPQGGGTRGIDVGPDGALWFTDFHTDRVGRITTSGDITMFSAPGLIDGPWGIARGPDDNLWFTNLFGHTIGRITALPEAAVMPGSPTGVTGTPDNASVAVSWTPPADDGGAPISGYAVTASPGSASCVTDGATGCTVTGLSNGSAYTFVVTASNAAGTGPASVPSAAVTPRTVPGAPTSVSAVAGDNEATVSWSAPADDGGASISGYTVSASPGGATCSTSGAVSCAVTGLPNAVEHTFTVVATNEAGPGPSSRPSPAVTPSTCFGADPPFPDVTTDHPFCRDIEWLSVAGVTGGFADGTFRPGSSVTRQSMSAFLYRFAGEPVFTPPATPSFPDVPVGAPFFVEVEWLTATGITSGYDDGTFRPSAPVTRQSMAAFLYRFAGEPVFAPPGTPSFLDVDPSQAFYLEIEWLAWTEIAGGFGDGTFRPATTVSRQAMAAFLHRGAGGPLD